MAAPLISVVVPCFNQAQFLADAVASVGRSATRDVEVIVVNDGSTDDTARVARELPGVRCVDQPNQGISRARNRGLAESRGRFVVFLDADDQLAPGALDVGAGELGARPGCALVFGRCRMMSDEGDLLPTADQPRIESHHYRELLKRKYIWIPAQAMFRRDRVERAGGFDPTLSASADYSLYLRIARANPVHDHGQVVAHYRRHGRNVNRDAGQMLQETLTALRRERSFVVADPELLAAYYEGWQYWRDFYGARLMDEIRAHLQAREWGSAARKSSVLGWLHPRALTRQGMRRLSSAVRRRKRSAQ